MRWTVRLLGILLAGVALVACAAPESENLGKRIGGTASGVKQNLDMAAKKTERALAEIPR